MGQPQIVVIDDSEAILAFTRSILAAHYAVSTANDGHEGFDLCRRLRPDLVLLDLSMPGLDGEGVLAKLKASKELESIPVIIISSEQARAEACLARGATSYLVKPVRAEELLALVARALEAARARAARGSLAILPLGVGPLELAIPLADVRQVMLQAATHPLVGGPSYLSACFELSGESVCVLDLAARFGVEHAQPILDRKMVLVEHEHVRLVLCVDRVSDPEEILPGDIHSIGPAAGSPDAELHAMGALLAVVRTSRGPSSVLRAHALLSRGLIRSLLERGARGAAAP